MGISKLADYMLLSYILIYLILVTVKTLPALRPLLPKILNTVLQCSMFENAYIFFMSVHTHLQMHKMLKHVFTLTFTLTFYQW